MAEGWSDGANLYKFFSANAVFLFWATAASRRLVV